MLPYGLLMVIWLASAAAARPRRFRPSLHPSLAPANFRPSTEQPALANATQTSAPPTTISLPPGDIQGPGSSTGGFGPCTDELQTCPFIIPELTTATGFEDPDEIKHTKPPVILPTSKPPAVTVKTTPTVLGVQTNYAPTAIPGGPGNYDTPSPPGQTVGPSHGNTPNSPNPQQPSNNDLLGDIISRVTNPQQPTGPEPVEPAPQVTGPGGTIINGLPITIGPASLILTPGLSTTVGTDTDAIFIGIRTDGTGQTIIVLSSSGTAVTATITNAPRTVTLPKSGFEASLTQAARPGDIVRTSSGGAAAATSSKGVAPGRDEMGWWSGLALGILGFGIVL